jgi:hypothetical protein
MVAGLRMSMRQSHEVSLRDVNHRRGGSSIVAFIFEVLSCIIYLMPVLWAALRPFMEIRRLLELLYK